MAKDNYNRNRNNNHRPNNRRNNPSRNSQQQMVEMPLYFAKALMRQLTYNPQNASSKKSRSYSVYTKENILKWLQAPTSSSNEKSLRDASNYMYLSSMHYNRLLNYYAGLYTGAYVISPLGFDGSVKDNFAKQYRKVSKAIELMNIPNILREEILIALRDGAFYGVLLDRKSVV